MSNNASNAQLQMPGGRAQGRMFGEGGINWIVLPRSPPAVSRWLWGRVDASVFGPPRVLRATDCWAKG
jgi:hypothetical protein